MYSERHPKKRKLDQKLAMFLTGDMQPVSTVEGNFFKEFSKELNPAYGLPSCITVSTKLILTLYQEEKKKLMNVLHEALWISLIVDIWTLRQNAAFMCISSHFIVAQMEKVLQKGQQRLHEKRRKI